MDTFSPAVDSTLFADDSNVTFSIPRGQPAESAISDVENTFGTWAKENGLRVNNAKTAVLIFRNGQTREAARSSAQINLCRSTRFLGVHIDEDLKFDVHVGRRIVQKAKISGLLLENNPRLGRSITASIRLFCSVPKSSVILYPVLGQRARLPSPADSKIAEVGTAGHVPKTQ